MTLILFEDLKLPSLENLCVKFVANNLNALCRTQRDLYPYFKDNKWAEDPMDVLIFKTPVRFSQRISEKLMAWISRNKKLTDQTIQLFSPQVTTLRYVYMPHTKYITTKGFSMLKYHKIEYLALYGLQLKQNIIFSILEDCQCQYLHTLILSKCVLSTPSQLHCVQRVISDGLSLSNVTSIDISHTLINQIQFEILVRRLTSLDSINISYTSINSIRYLSSLKGRLKSINMANVPISDERLSTAEFILSNEQLEYLDISDEVTYGPLHFVTPDRVPKLQFTDLATSLPNLTHLEISGVSIAISENLLIKFFENHPNIKFLGLLFNSACQLPILTDRKHRFFKHDLQVSGVGSLEQVITGCTFYTDRESYFCTCVHSLYSFSRQINLVLAPDIIKTLICGMEKHRKVDSIQLFGAAILYELLKATSVLQMHELTVIKLMYVVISAMRKVHTRHIIIRNSIFSVGSEVISLVAINRVKFISVAIDVLSKYEDYHVQKMCIVTIHSLVNEVTKEERLSITHDRFFSKIMVQLITTKVIHGRDDGTLKLTLEVLWKLTTNCEFMCQTLVEFNVIMWLMSLIQEYPLDGDVCGMATIVLYNISTFPNLCDKFVDESTLCVLRSMLRKHPSNTVCNAAGILLHILISPNLDNWDQLKDYRVNVLEELEIVLSKWDENVLTLMHLSFESYKRLLNSRIFSAQAWVLWVLRSFIMLHRENCLLIAKDCGLMYILIGLFTNSSLDTRIQSLAHFVWKKLLPFE